MKKIKDEEELFIPKERHFFKVFIILLIIATLTGIGYYYYQNYYSNPQKVVDKIIDTAKKQLNNSYESKLYKINGLFNFKMNLGNDLKEFTDIINKISLQVNGEFDKTNNTSNIDINTKYDDGKLFNINVYSENDFYYLYLEDLYNRYIQLNDTKESTERQNLQDNYPKIINGLVSALEKALKEQTFQRKNETITINNKKIEVNNNYLTLSNKEINNILINILESLVNDNDFINAFNKITKENGKQNIQNLISNLKEKDINGTYTLSFYTKKSFKQELVSIRQELTIENQKRYFDIDLIDENNIQVNISDGEETLEIKLYQNNKTYNGEISAKETNGTISLIFKINIEEIEEVTKQKVTNSIKIADLTDEDSQKISENLQKNETLLKLIDEISKITNKNTI